MKHVFKQLQIYRPETRVGESHKPCQFKTGCVIIDLECISAIAECTIFENISRFDDEVLNWLEKKHLILANIVLKDGSKCNNILVPNMNYFGVILGDVTF